MSQTRRFLLAMSCSLLGCLGGDPPAACVSNDCDPADDPRIPPQGDLGLVGSATSAPSGDVEGGGPADPGVSRTDDLAPFAPGHPVSCGDGRVEGDEECDDANAMDRDGCTSICEADRCGDGYLDWSEQCDDGNRFASDGCDSLCYFEHDACRPARREVCGHGETIDVRYRPMVTGTDTTDLIDSYAGDVEATTPEWTIAIVPMEDMRIHAQVLDFVDVLDLYVLPTDEHGCLPGSLEGSGDLVTWNASVGPEYHVVVEGLDPELINFPLRVRITCD